ncbi:MAG: tyrosine--tRNA ligase [Chloroflexi bacterium]|nr:tyrosine--tRNA ligase [Chloroflexota bacterium]
MASVDEQLSILMRGVDFGDDQIYETMKKELRSRLSEGRPLRVYCGYDPTATDLTLGHSVTMRKLRQFQDLGHHVVFLIGTFTGLIGDPSDKVSARSQQTLEEALVKSKTYTDQAFHILDRERTEIRYNHEWLAGLSFADVIQLASHFTVQQFLVRDNFSKRHANGDPIWLHEFFYALMQAYDAVALQTDVQLGGTEQLFNLMAGRKLQQYFGQRPQIPLTFPILVGTDGTMRMSKSQGNYIGLAELPEDMYGKIMSLPDHAMRNYFDLLSSFDPDEIEDIEKQIAAGSLHPRDAKMMLARDLVTVYHDASAAERAEAHFRRVFQEGHIPTDMPIFRLSENMTIVDLLFDAGMVSSKSEARRLIQQGGIRVDGELVSEISAPAPDAGEYVLQAGKRRFVRVVASPPTGPH